MKYNLSELLATRTTKQITNLVINRVKRDVAASEYNYQYDCYPYNEIKEYMSKIKKNDEILEDNSQWFNDAVFYIGKDLWNEIVLNVVDCLDCYGWDNIKNN